MCCCKELEQLKKDHANLCARLITLEARMNCLQPYPYYQPNPYYWYYPTIGISSGTSGCYVVSDCAGKAETKP